MSYQLLKEDILFYQYFLKANGYYTAKLDGKWGPKTDAADAAFLEQSNRIGTEYGFFDARIISGTRTYAEQNTLYRKGRYGSTENKVTNARSGQSNHNFGTAWDIGLFENGKYITDDKKYKQLAPLVTAPLPELEWGGHWHSFPDYPHYQHRTSVTSVSSVRHLFEAGEMYV